MGDGDQINVQLRRVAHKDHTRDVVFRVTAHKISNPQAGQRIEIGELVVGGVLDFRLTNAMWNILILGYRDR